MSEKKNTRISENLKNIQNREEAVTATAHACGMGDHRHGGLVHEIAAHLPYAVLSVALSISLLAFVSFYGIVSQVSVKAGSNMLFHVFHFVHIAFSASGTLLMCLRRKSGVFIGLIFSSICSLVFCTLSDSLIPVLGARMLGVDLHWCFCILHEFANILPFLLAGLLNGYVLNMSAIDQRSSSLLTHFVHVLVSSLASSFYLLAYGFSNWYEDIGLVFVFLVIAVVLPCTISDVIAPLIFTQARK